MTWFQGRSRSECWAGAWTSWHYHCHWSHAWSRRTSRPALPRLQYFFWKRPSQLDAEHHKVVLCRGVPTSADDQQANERDFECYFRWLVDPWWCTRGTSPVSFQSCGFAAKCACLLGGSRARCLACWLETVRGHGWWGEIGDWHSETLLEFALQSPWMSRSTPHLLEGPVAVASAIRDLCWQEALLGDTSNWTEAFSGLWSLSNCFS